MVEISNSNLTSMFGINPIPKVAYFSCTKAIGGEFLGGKIAKGTIWGRIICGNDCPSLRSWIRVGGGSFWVVCLEIAFPVQVL